MFNLWIPCTLNLPPGALHNFRCCRHALHCAGCFFTSKGEAWLRNAQKDREMTEMYGFALVGIAVWTDSAAMVRRCWKFLEILGNPPKSRTIPKSTMSSFSQSFILADFTISNPKPKMYDGVRTYKPSATEERRAKSRKVSKFLKAVWRNVDVKVQTALKDNCLQQSLEVDTRDTHVFSPVLMITSEYVHHSTCSVRAISWNPRLHNATIASIVKLQLLRLQKCPIVGPHNQLKAPGVAVGSPSKPIQLITLIQERHTFVIVGVLLTLSWHVHCLLLADLWNFHWQDRNIWGCPPLDSCFSFLPIEYLLRSQSHWHPCREIQYTWEKITSAGTRPEIQQKHGLQISVATRDVLIALHHQGTLWHHQLLKAPSLPWCFSGSPAARKSATVHSETERSCDRSTGRQVNVKPSTYFSKSLQLTGWQRGMSNYVYKSYCKLYCKLYVKSLRCECDEGGRIRALAVRGPMLFWLEAWPGAYKARSHRRSIRLRCS